MKKISEWLMELPEPYRSEALHNFKEQGFKDKTTTTLKRALLGAFIWMDTNEDSEGFKYWGKLWETL